jgi:hypothetical protein
VCKYTRKSKQNIFEISCDEATAKFEQKLQRLQENHSDEIKSTETIWQCHFETLQETEPSLKEFLANAYEEMPLYRLDPRSSGLTQI